MNNEPMCEVVPEQEKIVEPVPVPVIVVVRKGMVESVYSKENVRVIVVDHDSNDDEPDVNVLKPKTLDQIMNTGIWYTESDGCQRWVPYEGD